MTANAAAAALSPDRARALFDILTHYEVYSEIEQFKKPETTSQYGYPFSRSVPPAQAPVTAPATGGSFGFGFNLWGKSTASVASAKSLVSSQSSSSAQVEVDTAATSPPDGGKDARSTSPILQILVTRAILPLPGISNLDRDFYTIRLQGILSRLGACNLSESYDKGALGTRKTLATASSSIIEMLSRGAIGGLKKTGDGRVPVDEKFDVGKAEDIPRAWDGFLNGIVYDDLIDRLFAHMAKTDDLDSYSPMIRATVEHIIMYLATFVHYVFIKSPEGPYILKLLNNINSLMPYQMIKQTLRIGNAATMINGMVRIFLAKLSITGMTNWVGLTANEDDGMNLLQRIISLVLSWDSSEFKKISDAAEKAKGGPSSEVFQIIREHIEQPRNVQEALRIVSEQTSESIIMVILKTSNPKLAKKLTETQHKLCLDFYSAQLSIRDRTMISAVLCSQPPDLFTQAIKEVVAAYDPIIRSVHDRVDLHKHWQTLQDFITDFLNVSIPTKQNIDVIEPVTVEDYIQLLRRHRPGLHAFVHDLAKLCPEIWEALRVHCNNVMSEFKQNTTDDGHGGSPSEMDSHLSELVASLDPAKQEAVLRAVDAHSSYLNDLQAADTARFERLFDRLNKSQESKTISGPGVYLHRWEALLNETLITSAEEKAPPRHGKDVRHTVTTGKKGVDSAVKLKVKHGQPAPDVKVVVDSLGSKFHSLVQDIAAKEVNK